MCVCEEGIAALSVLVSTVVCTVNDVSLCVCVYLSRGCVCGPRPLLSSPLQRTPPPCTDTLREREREGGREGERERERDRERCLFQRQSKQVRVCVCVCIFHHTADGENNLSCTG